MTKLKWYRLKKVSRRKYNDGSTYSELRKMWRMSQREAKLNKGWVRSTFKEFVDSMIVISYKQ